MNTIDLKSGYLFGIPPQGCIEKWCCSEMQKLTGVISRTFHWGMLFMEDSCGWTCVESIYKGPAITRFEYAKAHIYRIRKQEGPVCQHDIISVASEYGEYPYDWMVNYKMAAWLLFQHYLHTELPVKINHKLDCVELVNAMSIDLVDRFCGDPDGGRLVPPDIYPLPVYLDHSPALEYLGVWQHE
jgi:hypothetical protein